MVDVTDTDATLPPFPVDDVTLTALEHAMEGVYTVDDDGTHHLKNAEYSVSQLLDFLSGYDSAKEVETDVPDVVEYRGQVYCRDDVIRALIAEVRRLRSTEIEPGVWFWSVEVGPHRHADHLQRTAPAHADCEPLRIYKER